MSVAYPFVAPLPLPLPQRGLCVEPRNADLKKNLKEIDELIRADKVRITRFSCSLAS